MSDDLLERRDEWLKSYRPRLRIGEQGQVISVGDGIAWVAGLPTAAMDDLLDFDDGSRGLVFDLTGDLVGAILLQETADLTAGTAARLRDKPLGIAVGDALLGRIIDPLGNPLDRRGIPECNGWRRLEAASPAIVERDFVDAPLYTGSKVLDTLIPIGRGQRQLLVGDEGLGRSSLALDTVINQRGDSVQCVYVLIGQKRTAVVNTIEILRDYGALEYTTLVVAEASALPGLQHLAPFAGCSIAEYWMRKGMHTLVVYDDLSTHAKNYRQLSLLLRRPPGREAYPGDIFSVHARLLERATCLNPENGGGSMTALPIIETQQGEIAAYIPTNLISITDGQVYLDRELFAGGFRPAIDIGKSVSRIGGRAQHPAIKREAGRMKLDYLQFLELEMFTRFGAKLEASMEKAIRRGRILREILKQERLSPLPIEFQLAWMLAFNAGLLDAVHPDKVRTLLDKLQREVAACELTLDDKRDRWLGRVRGWLGVKEPV
ncbi:F0F1 ATP synthase subunit alpha [Microbulbifer hydrolyticus]|uniref:ATP synthase subunit alpha n=1 Tax=Microbulbifer hydrolyticus TaxID=48074 RepID=A0A6P1TAS4_9GAMM|nr:F0F1 ATP synthase subunit alpha [Microbulbifer hydrolyticus]MBB5210408.1 F-type H+-transporting ATPase subunit alpha [Microbulbifer hydrolyticus]QHQ39107.1 F0F1 ATP synthase subunit alpha [Microbulbifer hydrolyticus]